MNNATRKTAPKSRRIVTLDPSQYALYQSGTIELRAPDGEVLETLGTYMHKAEAEVARERLQMELQLLVSLLGAANGFVELDKHAVAGMQDVLHRASEFIG
jgi:hypothetical protein